jgi:hypothetical protein
MEAKRVRPVYPFMSSNELNQLKAQGDAAGAVAAYRDGLTVMKAGKE